MGIIACVEVTTTTATSIGTTPGSTSTPSSSITPTTGAPATTETTEALLVGGVLPPTTTSTPTPPISGTTTRLADVTTTTGCQKQMANVNSQYVSSVVYSVQPVNGTNTADLTNTNSNGITFPPVPDITGLFDNNNEPLYQITMIFNPAGVDSLGTITINPNSNVEKFSVEFFVPGDLNQPVIDASTNQPLEFNSTMINSESPPTISNLPPQIPSPLGGIRINILKTTDNE